ncbi:MAG TPA: DUF3467 domain-containing protein [Bryobacteraceae bacterium]|nr:DUF3467 domain-containing protein [Bryobacteraceae bacterium]
MAKKLQAKNLRTKLPPLDVGENARAMLSKRFTQSPDFFSVYANDVQLQTSPFDVRMILGEMGDSDSGTATLQVKLLGEVRFSVELAKRLTQILAEQLRGYEERFGEIPAFKHEVKLPGTMSADQPVRALNTRPQSDAK